MSNAPTLLSNEFHINTSSINTGENGEYSFMLEHDFGAILIRQDARGGRNTYNYIARNLGDSWPLQEAYAEWLDLNLDVFITLGKKVDTPEILLHSIIDQGVEWEDAVALILLEAKINNVI